MLYGKVANLVYWAVAEDYGHRVMSKVKCKVGDHFFHFNGSSNDRDRFIINYR